MLTLSLYGPIGRRLRIGHSIHLNYYQKCHGSEETTNAPQSRHNGTEKQFLQWDGYSTRTCNVHTYFGFSIINQSQVTTCMPQ